MFTKEQKIAYLKKKFGTIRQTNISFKDTVDDIIRDINLREDEAKQYDEAKEFIEHKQTISV